MSTTFPFPVRLMAGVVATGLDRLRRLPAELPNLTVEAAGRALRVSMRLQQQVTELASRGDEVLAPLGPPPQERPPWAHFDEEDAAAEAADHAAADADDVIADDAVAEPAAADVDDVAASDDGGEDAAPAPEAMPDYPDLRIAQLRGRLRGLSSGTVAELLEFERSNRNRAAFVTMLDNRLTTLASAGKGPRT